MSFLRRFRSPKEEEQPPEKRHPESKGVIHCHRRTGSGSSAQSPRASPTVYTFRTPSSDHIAQVLPGLMLGSIEIAKDFDGLQKQKVTHILNVTTEVENYFPESFIYQRIDIPDLPSVNILQHFKGAFDFIEGARKEGTVLVHCHYGNSRSASFVIGYLLKAEEMKYLDALKYLRLLRPDVNPNEGFHRQLREYESKVRL